MRDPLDVPLEDSDLLEETVLEVELIVAANETPDDELPQLTIDRVLGGGSDGATGNRRRRHR
jgi:hypothetical protein